MRVTTRRAARPTLIAAVVTALALPLGLLGAAPATATPRVSPPSGGPGWDPVLTKGELVELTPGARQVKVAESPHGGAAAITWTVRNGNGVDELWARVKDESTWHARVRVSDPAAGASRHTIDLDSDGSLLVGWAEQRGTRRSLVARRVTGATAGARSVFDVDTGDGPYVAAGALHDVVAWTAPSGGVVRPFAAVDTGGGFAPATAMSSPSWRYDVVPGTLAVNADSRQVHAVYLSRDTDAGWVQTSWSVLDSTQGSAWVPSDDLGPRQQPGEPARRPLVATDNRGVATLVLYATDEQVVDGRQVRYPEAMLFDPAAPGPLRTRLTSVRTLEVGDESGLPRDVLSIRNRRDVVVAAYAGGPAHLKQVTVPTSNDFAFHDWTADALCAPRGQHAWFFTWQQEDAEIHCLNDDRAGEPGGPIGIDHNNFGELSAITPDPALPGSSLRAEVPDPLISLVVVTEDLPGTTADPTWVLDHTAGGSDRPDPLLRFTRLKAPSVTGAARVGKTLTATAGTWRPGPSEIAHRWYVNGSLVKGATSSTFRLAKAHRGKRVSVRLHLSRAGYHDQVVEVKRAEKVAPKKKPKKANKKKKKTKKKGKGKKNKKVTPKKQKKK